MKGAVFNGFENFVIDRFGLAAWQAVLDESQTENAGIYLGSEFYPDSEMTILVQTLSRQINQSLPDVLRSFGQYFFMPLFNSVKSTIAPIDNLFDFLIAVDKVIHVQVKKSAPQAYTPTLFYDKPDENTLLLRYVSSRNLCFLAEGLIIGAAEKFNESIKISQTTCVHCGDKDCIIKVEKCHSH